MGFPMQELEKGADMDRSAEMTTTIDANGMDHRTINERIRSADGKCLVSGCCGQRFIAAGMSDKDITIDGIPGNALGSYLNGGKIEVLGNAQDAVGDTMNNGTIVVHGNLGDAVGYAMRGGKIYVRGNAGYRAGIHVKAYKDKVPLIVIGGRSGSFLGEYQAGGVIVILNLDTPDRKCVGFFPCTGMHGGKVYLRSECSDVVFPKQVKARKATKKDMDELKKLLSEYIGIFNLDENEVLSSCFTVITPDSENPYRQMYVAN